MNKFQEKKLQARKYDTKNSAVAKNNGNTKEQNAAYNKE